MILNFNTTFDMHGKKLILYNLCVFYFKWLIKITSHHSIFWKDILTDRVCNVHSLSWKPLVKLFNISYIIIQKRNGQIPKFSKHIRVYNTIVSYYSYMKKLTLKKKKNN